MLRAVLSKPTRLHVNELIRIVAEEPQRVSQMLGLNQGSEWQREYTSEDEVWCPRLCANMRELVSRTTNWYPLQVAPRPAVASFYGRALGMHPPQQKHDELLAKAEALLGITESADVALVINMRQLPQLHAKFPWLQVRHWYDTHDTFSAAAFDHAMSLLSRHSDDEANSFYSQSPKTRDDDEVTFAHTRYRRIVDATDDAELWSSTHAVPPPNEGAMPSVDVLLHAPWGTPTSRLLTHLSSSMWARSEYQYAWKVPGRRRDSDPQRDAAPLEIVFVPLSLNEEVDTMCIPLREQAWDHTSRLPSSAGPDHDAAAMLTPREEVALAEIRDTLRTLAASKAAEYWPSVAQDAVVYKFTCNLPHAALDDVSDADAELYDFPGLSSSLAARVVTRISAQCVARALDAGHIASGRMAFVDARCNDVATLKNKLWQQLYCTDNTDEAFATLAAATRGARDIVFFCRDGYMHSAARAKGFHEWLRKVETRVHEGALPRPCVPRVRLLEGGMAALLRCIYKKHGEGGWETRFRTFDRSFRW